MINSSVETFYVKNPESSYMETYEYSHGPRLDALVARYNLKDLRGRVVDIGGGMGFLGKRLDPSVDYWVIDGADIPGTERPVDASYLPPLEHKSLIRSVKLCRGTYIKQDVNQDYFSSPSGIEHAGCGMHRNYSIDMGGQFDYGFALEILEHLSNPYHCLEQMKKLIRPDGLIYISIPPPSVWHNTIYCGLLWPKENFLQFLGQMSLPVIDQWDYQPESIGWPAWHFVCRNRPWEEKKMAFEKAEEKFKHATPLEMTNL